MKALIAKPAILILAIVLLLIVGCVASRQPVRPPLPPKPPMVLPLPTAARVMPDTNRPALPPMEHGVISWGPAELPDDTMGRALFIIYKATNLLQPQWRYLTETYSTNTVISTTQHQAAFFKVESYRLALGVKR